MTGNNKPKPAASQPPASGPVVYEPGDRLNAYVIKDRDEGKKSIWTKIGAAWINRDGSINVVLEATPLDGKLHLRPPREDEEQAD